MARTTVTWLTAVNLVLGVFGLWAPTVAGADGFFNFGSGRLLAFLTINWAHAGIHLAFGLWGLTSRRSRSSSLACLRGQAVVFGVLSLLGILGHLGWLRVQGHDGGILVLEVAVDGLGTLIHTSLALLGAAVLWRDEQAAPGPAGPPALALLSGGVIAVILAVVLVENLKVAPWAEHGGDGRLHAQMKNVTRLEGSAPEVAGAVRRALGPATSDAPASDWREAILQQSGWSGDPGHVVVLAAEGDDARLWSLPGAYWAAFSGVPVVFVGRDDPPQPVGERLARLGLPVYVLAPPDLVSDEAMQALALDGRIERLAGDTPAEHAVAIASYRDPETGFGWGRNHADNPTWFHFFMSAPQDADAAYAALPLARRVAGAFLLARENGGIPAATDRYWWSLRGDWAVTPSETSFRHLWILGDGVSYGAQGRLDLAVEKAAYISMGAVGLSGLEGIGITLIALGIAGFVFVLAHGSRLLPEVMPAMRIAWAFTALLLPVGGVILYLAAYRRPRLDRGPGRARWLRPPAVQAAAATAMGFGYGAPLMIAVGWAFAFYGFPLFFGPWADGPGFVLGAGMPLMMAGMYVGAVLIAWPAVQVGMQAMMIEGSRRQALWRGLGVTALSMAAVSLGMMTMSWFMMMERDPMMMPHEDETLWIVSLWLASIVGFLVAWPLNWPMVRKHLKSGTM